MLTDLRIAVRGFRRTPAFTITALVTLALCLGANLTIFSVIDSVLLRHLPFANPDRLVTMYNAYPNAGVPRDGSSITNYFERRGTLTAFASLSMYRQGTALIGEPGSTERTDVLQVSSEFFSTLGVTPSLGRAFTEDETNEGGRRVAILTDAWWRQHHNADPSIIGRQVRMDGIAREVVGVLPPTYRFLSHESRIILPFVTSLADRSPNERYGGRGLDIVARLAPGVTIAQAEQQVAAQNAVLLRDFSEAKMISDAGWHTPVVGLHADHVASIRPTLLLLQGGVLLLVLIGAVNLVNLLLIRASARGRELAIRQSMGANWRHIVTGVMSETLVLTLAGGALSIAVGAVGVRMLSALGVAQLPLGALVAVNARVAVIQLAGAALLGIVFGVPLAWFNLRGQLATSLKSESRGGTATRAAQRLRHAFIVAQVSLAFVLLSGSGLLALSLKRAMDVSTGFRPEQVITGKVSLPYASYSSTTARVALTDRVMQGLRQQPGTSAVGFATNIPFSGRNNLSGIAVEGHEPRPGESMRGHYYYAVGGDYFAAMGIPLRAGRLLTSDDVHGTQRVAVVDEDYARHYFPKGNVVGTQFYQGGLRGNPADAFTVVGVVGAAKQADLTESQRQGAVYVPYTFNADNQLFIVARTRHDPALLAGRLTSLVRSIDADLPVDGIRAMDLRIADSLLARRTPALLLSVFAGVALLLAAVGTYGVLSYAVSQRRREIGVRLALGAQPSEVGNFFFRIGARLLVAGTLVGVLGAWLSGRVLQGLLYDVPALHPVTLGATIAVMTIVSLAASLIPARRAARVDPLVALGSE